MQAAMQQVLDRQIYNHLLVGDCPGKIEFQVFMQQIHRGYPQAAYLPADGCIDDAHYQPVGFPLHHSARYGVLDEALLMNECPGTISPGISGNSAEQFPTVGAGRLDQKRYAEPLGHD